MFLIDVAKVISNVTQTEDMTSGSQNVYVAQFNFSDEWQYLDRTAVFRAGDTVVNIVLGADNRCMVPWEVMVDPFINVEVGAFGTHNGNIVMPTIWASMGTMLQGVITGIRAEEPTPSVYDQILANYNQLVADMAAGKLKGDKGDPGPQGPQGIQGIPGSTGPQGPKGNTGESYLVIDAEFLHAPMKNMVYAMKREWFNRDPKDGESSSGIITVGPDSGGVMYFVIGTVGITSDGITLRVEKVTQLSGVEGPQGLQGPKGDTGAPGPQGPQGIQGEVGPKGDKGDTGEVGPQGPKGDKGDVGETGPQGLTGPKGDTGDPGPKGDKGDTGDQGPKGDTGDSYLFVDAEFDDPPMAGMMYEMQGKWFNRIPKHGESCYGIIRVTTESRVIVYSVTGTVAVGGSGPDLITKTVTELSGPVGPEGPQGAKGETGPKGDTGESGFSPTVATETIDGGTKVNITDANGVKSFDVMNGSDTGFPYFSAAFYFNTTKDDTVTDYDYTSLYGKSLEYTIWDDYMVYGTLAVGKNFAAYLVLDDEPGLTYYCIFTLDKTLEIGYPRVQATLRSAIFVGNSYPVLNSFVTFFDVDTLPELNVETKIPFSSAVGLKPHWQNVDHTGFITCDGKLYLMDFRLEWIIDDEQVFEITPKKYTQVGGTGTELTAGDGMTITDGVASVNTPVKSILTQAEFDALPEAEQNKGMYVISDGSGGGAGGSGGGESLDVYSTEERRIGTWIDGKPLYRRVVTGEFVCPGISAPAHIRILSLANVSYKNQYGIIHDTKYNVHYPVPFNNIANYTIPDSRVFELVILTGNENGVEMYVALNSFNSNMSYEIVLEYTKTTDESEVSA